MYSLHKDSDSPTTQESALKSELNQEISIYLKTDLTHTLQIWPLSLLQWDLVLSEIESSICLCPGWNEMGFCRVLQLVERRIWLSAFDSALYGQSLTALAPERGRISPEVGGKHFWMEDYSADLYCSPQDRSPATQTTLSLMRSVCPIYPKLQIVHKLLLSS